MEELDPKRRVGYVRIGRTAWDKHSEDIKQSTGEGNILSILQSVGNGCYLNSTDVIFIHPDFKEIGSGDPLQQSGYVFNEDGHFELLPSSEIK